MDAEISFGEFQQSQPKSGVAPDRNPHFAVAWVGEPTDAWPIFVDLDVMRELESHAVDNVNVELGGVLLGDQMIDPDGRPFVVVRDSLRAEHYEATRGSFKFTHETWEAITRQREQFPDKFAIVGWYHTHPGWGVFLSDMDMFICDHFFNRSLDVALVIDPVRDDRGWFCWSQESRPASKQRSASFGLFAHRHREEELQAVAGHYNERATMSADPRLRMSKPAAAPTTITLAERSLPPSILIGLAVLILGQLILMTAVLWQGSAPANVDRSATTEQTQMDLLVRERQAQTKADTYREMLAALAEKTPEAAGLVDRLTAASEQNTALKSNLEGQSALTQQLKDQSKMATEQLARLTLENKDFAAKLAQRDISIKALQAKFDEAKPAIVGAAKDSSTKSIVLFSTIAALIATIASGIGGYFWGRRQESLESAEMISDDTSRGPPRDDSKIKLA